LPSLKQIARFEYGDALAQDQRTDGDVPVFGSNGITGVHNAANTLSPAIILGRKGSFGKVTWTDTPGFCIDTAYYIDRRHTGANLRWLYWTLQTLDLDVHSEDTGVPGLSREKAYQAKVRCPSDSEQQHIANFLDKQTALIDALIAEKMKLQELLAEQERSQVWSLITKGANPSAPRIATCAQWIAEVPAHWKVRKIKWITPVARGASPRPIDDPKYFDIDGEYAWVRIADVTASEGYLTQTEQQLSELGASLSVKREPGDLFLSIAGTVGKPCITGIKCCIHDGFVWFPGVTSTMLRDWMFNIFETGLAYAGLGKIGTQLNLNTDTVGNIEIPLPPSLEMSEILAEVSRVKETNRALYRHVTAHINRLREYRSSLISAAVTGQLKINTFTSNLPEA